MRKDIFLMFLKWMFRDVSELEQTELSVQSDTEDEEDKNTKKPEVSSLGKLMERDTNNRRQGTQEETWVWLGRGKKGNDNELWFGIC